MASKNILTVCVALLGVSAVGVSHAATIINEADQGDAGELPSTARVTVGASPLAAIVGSFESGFEDVDLYEIQVTDPATFTVAVRPTSPFPIDTMLYLFDQQGSGVAANDDATLDRIIFDGVSSEFPAGSIGGLTSGRYFVGVSTFEDVPLSVSGSDLFDFFFALPGDVIASSNPAPVAQWGFDGFNDDAGPYEILFAGAAPALPSQTVIPEPASVAIWAFGGCLMILVFVAGANRSESGGHSR